MNPEADAVDNLTDEQFAEMVEAQCSPAAKRIAELELENARLREVVREAYNAAPSAPLGWAKPRVERWLSCMVEMQDLILPNAKDETRREMAR